MQELKELYFNVNRRLSAFKILGFRSKYFQVLDLTQTSQQLRSNKMGEVKFSIY